MRVVSWHALLCFALQVWAAGGDHEHLGPQGYRMSHYRAPTPDSAPHAVTLDTDGLRRLLQSETVVLVDVQAVVERPETEDFGFAWLPNEPRYHIPDSTWLPNVGKGELTPRMDNYFRDNLQRITSGDLQTPLVLYCVADCWMSWNAVRRAHGYGYRVLYWYRDGTDGWEAEGLPLVEAEPVELLLPDTVE